jgi:NADPH-dependent 2,4-dienoyl-CoA reductase/sulfur reductase-like enzyme
VKADIAIVGAGPAGLAAAAAALRCQHQVVLIDDNASIGGQIWRGKPSIDNYTAMLTHPRMTYLASTRVVAAPRAGQLLLETATDATNLPINLHYARLIVASGARERLLPFPGWTLPGVMGVGGLQAMVKSGMSVRGQRIVLAGTGPLLLAAADTLKRAGAEVAMIAEQARGRNLVRFAISLLEFPSKIKQAAELLWALRGIPYHPDNYVCEAVGHQRLHGVRLQSGSGSRSQSLEISCDWLGVGYGLLPNTELLQTLGCALDGDHALVDAHLRTSIANIYAVGESTGVGGVDKAVLEGRIAGVVASGSMADLPTLLRQRRRHLRFVQALTRHFALRPEIAAQISDDTIVCRCEDVTHSRLAAFGNWREAKLQTRCGMGPCQGRLCAESCAALYGWRDAHQHTRPPLQPARLGTLASATISNVDNIGTIDTAFTANT